MHAPLWTRHVTLELVVLGLFVCLCCAVRAGRLAGRIDDGARDDPERAAPYVKAPEASQDARDDKDDDDEPPPDDDEPPPPPPPPRETSPDTPPAAPVLGGNGRKRYVSHVPAPHGEKPPVLTAPTTTRGGNGRKGYVEAAVPPAPTENNASVTTTAPTTLGGNGRKGYVEEAMQPAPTENNASLTTTAPAPATTLGGNGRNLEAPIPMEIASATSSSSTANTNEESVQSAPPRENDAPVTTTNDTEAVQAAPREVDAPATMTTTAHDAEAVAPAPPAQNAPMTTTTTTTTPARDDEPPVPMLRGLTLSAGHVLGDGCFGEVRFATDGARRRYAVKVCKPGVKATSFQAEVAILRRLPRHPNLVALWGLAAVRVRNGETTAIVTGYAGEVSLGDALLVLTLDRRDAALFAGVIAFDATDRRWRLRTGAALFGALAAVHAVGIAHHDVKPDNVVLSRRGAPTLVDFGLAKAFGPAHADDSFGGACTYMMPAVLAGRVAMVEQRRRPDFAYDPAANDVWSCCALVMDNIWHGEPTVRFVKSETPETYARQDAIHGDALADLHADDNAAAIRLANEIIAGTRVPRCGRAPAAERRAARAVFLERDPTRWPTAASIRDDLVAAIRADAI